MLPKILAAGGMLSNQVRDQCCPQALSVHVAARIPGLRFIPESQEQLRNERVFCAEGRSKLKALVRSGMAGYRVEEVGLDLDMNLVCSTPGSSRKWYLGGHEIDAARAEAPDPAGLTRPGDLEQLLSAEKKSHAVSEEAAFREVARRNMSLIEPDAFPRITAGELGR